MTDQEKYYTPDISEFHVGFEYEIKGELDSNWIKKTITLNETWYHTNKKFPVHYNWYIENNRIRVKYLDREDTEGLEWEYKQSIAGTNIIEFEFQDEKNKHPINKIKEVYYLDVSAEHSGILFARIHQTITNIVPEKRCLFQGFIKNKAELKKMMQQLRIC